VSASSVVVVIEGGLILVLVLFVVALLRSHAEILRRLAGLEGGAPLSVQAPSGSVATAAPQAVVGQTLAGDTVKLALGPGSPRTLLSFLSSGCAACEPLWADLHTGPPVPAGTRLVIVTKGSERESASRLAALAPAGQEVVMSTRAFEDFAVPVTPHFVLLDAGGQISGRGSAGSWQQILTLLGDADADRLRATDSAARAARAEAALAAAGVAAGHSSLYPSRPPEAPR
jgi:hypothetical protein